MGWSRREKEGTVHFDSVTSPIAMPRREAAPLCLTLHPVNEHVVVEGVVSALERGV